MKASSRSIRICTRFPRRCRDPFDAHNLPAGVFWRTEQQRQEEANGRRYPLVIPAFSRTTIAPSFSTLSSDGYSPNFENTSSWNPSTTSEGAVQDMQARAKRLLDDTPVGQYTAESWMEGEDVIKWWSVQRTAESVQICHRLLERFVQEYRTKSTTSGDLSLFFSIDLINAVIDNWHQVWLNHEHNEDGKVMAEKLRTPQQVLDQMDQYATEFPHVRALYLSGNALTHILAAAASATVGIVNEGRDYSGYSFETVPSTAYRRHHLSVPVAAPFCDKVIHRLLDMEHHANARKAMLFLGNNVLRLWSKSGRGDAVPRAEALFTRMHTSFTDTFTYNTMLDVYAQARMANEANALLHQMCDEWLNKNRIGYDVVWAVRPDDISVNTTAAAWAKFSSADENAARTAASQISILLNRLLNPFDLGRLKIQPNTIFFNTFILCLARSKKPASGREAEAVLRNHMLPGGEFAVLESVKADAISYGTVVMAHAMAGNPQEAERVYKELFELYVSERDPSLRPNTVMLTQIMDAWAKSSAPNRLDHVRSTFDHMKMLHKEGILEEAPDAWALNIVINTICASKEPNKVHIAMDLLEEMQARHAAGDESVKPTDWTYTPIIRALLEDPRQLFTADDLLLSACESGIDFDLRTIARMIQVLSKRGYTLKAEKWLYRLFDACKKGKKKQRPNAGLIGAVLGGWVKRASSDPKSGEPAERAIALTRTMKELYDAGHLKEGPDNHINRAVISCCVRVEGEYQLKYIDKALAWIEEMRRTAHKTRRVDELPDKSIYQQILRALSLLGRKEQAESVLKKMMQDEEVHGKNKPTIDQFNEVLKSWAVFLEGDLGQTGKRMDDDLVLGKVSSICETMQQMQETGDLGSLNRITYNTIIKIWASTNRNDSPERAERLLRKMIEEAEGDGSSETRKTDLRPTSRSYEPVILAWLRASKPAEAERVLTDMYFMHMSGYPHFKPSLEILLAIGNAYTQSKSVEADEVKRALIRLLGMKTSLYDEKSDHE